MVESHYSAFRSSKRVETYDLDFILCYSAAHQGITQRIPHFQVFSYAVFRDSRPHISSTVVQQYNSWSLSINSLFLLQLTDLTQHINSS